MLNSEFINKAINLTITEADNGLFYLEPTWRNILYDNKLNVSDVSDIEINLSDVSEILKLEVEKRNAINSKKNDVINWLYDIIMTQVEPAILQEETDYIKQVVEFMKTNHETQNDKEWDEFKKV